MSNLEYNFTYRKKDKGIQVILSYKDAKGRWRQKSKQGLKGKKEAKLAGDRLLDSVKKSCNADIDVSMSGTTLRQVLEMFLAENRDALEYNTRLTYCNALKAFKDIADIKLTDIDHADIVSCLSEMTLSASTKQVYASKLNTVLKYAINPCRILARNPADGIKLKKDKREKRIAVLSPADFEKLLDFVKGKNYVNYVKIAIAGYAGLRYGEILGLTWDAVDLKNGEISVRAQLSLVGKNRYKIKPVKSMNGYRTVPIPLDLIKILREYRKIVPERMDRRLFGDKTTSTFCVNYLIREAGHKNMSIHSLRHTYATRLVANGVDVKTIAALIGDTVHTVLVTYIHYSDDMRRQAKDDISRIFA